jgi:hypothetical protein
LSTVVQAAWRFVGLAVGQVWYKIGKSPHNCGQS